MMAIRLVQLRGADGARQVAAVEDDGAATLVTGVSHVQELALAAIDACSRRSTTRIPRIST
jgi:hypothetical protein